VDSMTRWVFKGAAIMRWSSILYYCVWRRLTYSFVCVVSSKLWPFSCGCICVIWSKGSCEAASFILRNDEQESSEQLFTETKYEAYTTEYSSRR
jgi:hypothetical protein